MLFQKRKEKTGVRLLSALCVLCLLVTSLAAMPVLAADTASITSGTDADGNTYFNDLNGTKFIYTYDEPSGTLTISKGGDSGDMTTDSTSAKKLPWYDKKASIKKIVLEKDLTTVGDYEFSGYKALEEVVFPSTMKTIGRQAFDGCTSLKIVDLTSTKVTYIAWGAFSNCTGLTSFKFNNGVSTSNKIMQNVTLDSIVIPRFLGGGGLNKDTFLNANIKTIYVYNDSPAAKEWAKSVTSNNIGSAVIEYIDYTGTVIKNGSLKNGDPDKADLTWSFTDEGVLTISGEGTVPSMPTIAGADVSVIKKVIFENGITGIAKDVLAACADIPLVDIRGVLDETSLTVDVATKAWEFSVKDAAANPNRKWTVVNKTGTSGNTTWEIKPIGDTATAEIVVTAKEGTDGKMQDLSYSSDNEVGKLQKDEPWASKDYIVKATVSSGVTTVGSRAFKYFDKLTEVNIADTVTQIGDWAFGNCTSLKSINIPEGVTRLAMNIVEGSGITEITIPTTVATIYPYKSEKDSYLDKYTFANNMHINLYKGSPAESWWNDFGSQANKGYSCTIIDKSYMTYNELSNNFTLYAIDNINDATLIFANYADENLTTLKDVKYETGKNFTKGSNEIKIPSTLDQTNGTTTVFLWKNMTELTPLCESVSKKK